MKIADIRKLDTNEIAMESTKLREEIAQLRLKLYSGELPNVRAIRGKRKDLARLMTVMSEQLAKEIR